LRGSEGKEFERAPVRSRRYRVHAKLQDNEKGDRTLLVRGRLISSRNAKKSRVNRDFLGGGWSVIDCRNEEVFKGVLSGGKKIIRQLVKGITGGPQECK